MKVKAVIFDMDGVIIDSEPIESLAWEKVLAEYKIKPIFGKSGLIHEVGEPDFKNIIDRHDLLNEDLESIRFKKRTYFEELIIDSTLTSGTMKLLGLLKKAKLKVALASSRNERHVGVIMDKFGLRKKFDSIIGFSEKVRRKPFPDIFLKAASELKIAPASCAVIEDSGAGVLAGKNAGMKVIAVPNKWTAHQDFSKADKVISSLSEITIAMLKNL